MFDFGADDDPSDYTVHYGDGHEEEIQNNYASDLMQDISDMCEALLGDADEVEPDGVVVVCRNGNIAEMERDA